MDDISIFPDKTITPTESDLVQKLDSAYDLWIQIKDFVLSKYPNGIILGKNMVGVIELRQKRAIIYFLPRDKFFKVAFAFGQKATDIIMSRDIDDDIKAELIQARKYAEGRGIRIEIKNELLISDIKKLIEIKLTN